MLREICGGGSHIPGIFEKLFVWDFVGDYLASTKWFILQYHVELPKARQKAFESPSISLSCIESSSLSASSSKPAPSRTLSVSKHKGSSFEADWPDSDSHESKSEVSWPNSSLGGLTGWIFLLGAVALARHTTPLPKIRLQWGVAIHLSFILQRGLWNPDSLRQDGCGRWVQISREQAVFLPRVSTRVFSSARTIVSRRLD